MAFKYKVLSIDGGGIRGIIPAKILAEIERRTGKPTSQLFNLIAGTSTGGIVSLALTKPDPKDKTKPHYTASDVIDLYVNNGAKIFQESFIGSKIKGDDLIGPKFPAKGRDEVLQKYFGDTQLKEALTNLFITSYDIQLRTPVFFVGKNKREKGAQNFRKLCHTYTMKQAAMATSAAPTYFEPYAIPVIDTFLNDRNFYTLVDGGLFANNPTSLAMMEALISSQEPGKTPLQLNEILIVSLGTGSLIRKYAYEDAKKWGLLKWVQPLINIVLDSGSESVTCQLEQLLPDIPGPNKQYYRFQGLLKGANDDMDDATPKNIENLLKLTDKIIQENGAAIDQLVEVLSQ